MLDVDPKRLEVFVLRGLPTRSDVSIVPAQTNTSKSADEVSVCNFIIPPSI